MAKRKPTARRSDEARRRGLHPKQITSERRRKERLALEKKKALDEARLMSNVYSAFSATRAMRHLVRNPSPGNVFTSLFSLFGDVVGEVLGGIIGTLEYHLNGTTRTLEDNLAYHKQKISEACRLVSTATHAIMSPGTFVLGTMASAAITELGRQHDLDPRVTTGLHIASNEAIRHYGKTNKRRREDTSSSSSSTRKPTKKTTCSYKFNIKTSDLLAQHRERVLAAQGEREQISSEGSEHTGSKAVKVRTDQVDVDAITALDNDLTFLNTQHINITNIANFSDTDIENIANGIVTNAFRGGCNAGGIEAGINQGLALWGHVPYTNEMIFNVTEGHSDKWKTDVTKRTIAILKDIRDNAPAYLEQNQAAIDKKNEERNQHIFGEPVSSSYTYTADTMPTSREILDMAYITSAEQGQVGGFYATLRNLAVFFRDECDIDFDEHEFMRNGLNDKRDNDNHHITHVTEDSLLLNIVEGVLGVPLTTPEPKHTGVEGAVLSGLDTVNKIVQAATEDGDPLTFSFEVGSDKATNIGFNGHNFIPVYDPDATDPMTETLKDNLAKPDEPLITEVPDIEPRVVEAESGDDPALSDNDEGSSTANTSWYSRYLETPIADSIAAGDWASEGTSASPDAGQASDPVISAELNTIMEEGGTANDDTDSGCSMMAGSVDYDTTLVQCEKPISINSDSPCYADTALAFDELNTTGKVSNDTIGNIIKSATPFLGSLYDWRTSLGASDSDPLYLRLVGEGQSFVIKVGFNLVGADKDKTPTQQLFDSILDVGLDMVKDKAIRRALGSRAGNVIAVGEFVVDGIIAFDNAVYTPEREESLARTVATPSILSAGQPGGQSAAAFSLVAYSMMHKTAKTLEKAKETVHEYTVAPIRGFFGSQTREGESAENDASHDVSASCAK